MSRVLNISADVYWAVLPVSGLICAIGYSLVPKHDATAIQVLIFLHGVVALPKHILNRLKTRRMLDKTSTQVPPLSPATRPKRFCFALFRYFNRLLRIVRFLLAGFFIAGAIGLAERYHYKNPLVFQPHLSFLAHPSNYFQSGTLSRIVLPSGASVSISYYCTKVSSSNSTVLPTIWFEADAAHGTTDFLGVQTALAEQYGRNSCSYDPPNFGWSGRWPSSESTDLTTVFEPLLRSIQRDDEVKVLAGWGAGGENVLRHAIQNPNSVKAVVLLDTAPTGIEWTDQARAKNLSAESTLALAKQDMSGRVSLAQIILGMGVPW